MTDILMLCAASGVRGLLQVAGPLMFEVIRETGIEPSEVTGVSTQSERHGRAMVALFTADNRVDVIVAFGKTTASLMLHDMPMMASRTCIVDNLVTPTTVVHLPSPVSRWWIDPANVLSAIDLLADVIRKPVPTSLAGAHLAWGNERWN